MMKNLDAPSERHYDGYRLRRGACVRWSLLSSWLVRRNIGRIVWDTGSSPEYGCRRYTDENDPAPTLQPRMISPLLWYGAIVSNGKRSMAILRSCGSLFRGVKVEGRCSCVMLPTWEDRGRSLNGQP
eukprot:scaffold21743_cov144-Skeletonema_dohrnii-CCMP3373.AAC.21